jgi:hypothetical protein
MEVIQYYNIFILAIVWWNPCSYHTVDTVWWNWNYRFWSIHGTPKEVSVMVYNATFNNISAISWQSVLLVEETRVPRENH